MLVLGIHPTATAVGVAIVYFDPKAIHLPRLVTADTLARTLPCPGVYTPVPLRFLEDIHKATVDPVVAIGGESHTVDLVAIAEVPASNLDRTQLELMTDPAHAADIVATWCHTITRYPVLVPTARSYNLGAMPLGNYPTPLVDADERRDPKWRVLTTSAHAPQRHARTAYDVAVAGHHMIRQGAGAMAG